MADSIETNVSDMSLDDLSREELLDIYNKLRKCVQVDQEEIEKLDQELHDAQREISSLSILENEVTEEIDELQTNEDIESENVEIQLAEDKIKIAKQNNQESMNDLRQLLIETTEATRISEDHLKQLKSNCGSSNESEQIVQENVKLQADIGILTGEVEIVQEAIQQCIDSNQKLLGQVKEMENELECLKDSSDYSSSELSTCKETIESLQGEIALLRVEIESIKSVPLDAASRGNSLFAEVHDRRVLLENKLSSMKSTYLTMQNEHESLLRQIKCLQGENVELTLQWEHDMYLSEKHNDNEQWYKGQLAKLEATVESKLSELGESFVFKTKNIATEEETFMNNYYDRKEKLIVTLLNALLVCMKERIKLAYELCTTNSAAREFHVKVEQLECETNNIKTDRDALYVERKINTHCICEHQNNTNKKLNFLSFVHKGSQPHPSTVESGRIKAVRPSNQNNIVDQQRKVPFKMAAVDSKSVESRKRVD